MAHTDTRRCVPGASYCSVADLLIQTKQRLVVHIRISVKQANLLAALQHHTAQCACDADSAALAQVPDVQANQIRQLREKWTANDDQAEAMNVAMLLETEEHELEMAKLYARITELENEYSPWKANIDKVESATW